jgi:predicted transposase/invertase (TIGR01784 family)
MKECVEEFKDFDVNYIADSCIDGIPQISEVSLHRGSKPEKIIGSNTEDKTADEGTVFFDIRFVAILPQSGENIRLIINIEAQNNYNPGYSLIRRGLYYCCRLISAQYGTEFANEDYDNLKKVYSIWVCTNTPNYAKNTITKYCISEKNMIGNFQSESNKYDILNLIMICLDKDSQNTESSEKGILKLLRILLSGMVDVEKKKLILNDDFDIKKDIHIEEELNAMCNISEGIRSIALEQGIEQGIEQGEKNKQIDSLKKLIKNLHLTFEQAADALELSEEERESLAAMI